MRAHNNVYRALFKPLQNAGFIGGRIEARKQRNVHRETRKAGGKRIVMLLRKYCCRHKERHLLAVCHGLERGAKRNLRLSVANIAAKEPIHNALAFHILFYFGNARKLIRRFLIGKAFLQPPLPRRIGREGMALPVQPVAI